jgi:signal transduction histidine kinase
MFLRLKEAEDQLESSRNQLRALAANLLSVRDSERSAIARELHDEFGQALTSLQLGLSWLSRHVSADQRSLQAKIRSLTVTTTSLIQSVRSIAGELRPGVLDELGLPKALKSAAREFERDNGIPCRFNTNTGTLKFDRPAAIAVFRIVQAALTNTARHAHASSVIVSLIKSKNGLTLAVKDNGKGVTRKLIDSHTSIGIAGMRERAHALGGTFTLEGSRNQGTTLTVWIPLSRAVIGR